MPTVFPSPASVSEAKTGRASISARRFTASSEYKHPHLLRRMFYEHGALAKQSYKFQADCVTYVPILVAL